MNSHTRGKAKRIIVLVLLRVMRKTVIATAQLTAKIKTGFLRESDMQNRRNVSIIRKKAWVLGLAKPKESLESPIQCLVTPSESPAKYMALFRMSSRKKKQRYILRVTELSESRDAAASRKV